MKINSSSVASLIGLVAVVIVATLLPPSANEHEDAARKLNLQTTKALKELVNSNKPPFSVAELRSRYYGSGDSATERGIQVGWLNQYNLALINPNVVSALSARLHENKKMIYSGPQGTCSVKVVFGDRGLTIFVPSDIRTCKFARFSEAADWVSPDRVLTSDDPSANE